MGSKTYVLLHQIVSNGTVFETCCLCLYMCIQQETCGVELMSEDIYKAKLYAKEISIDEIPGTPEKTRLSLRGTVTKV